MNIIKFRKFIKTLQKLEKLDLKTLKNPQEEYCIIPGNF